MKTCYQIVTTCRLWEVVQIWDAWYVYIAAKTISDHFLLFMAQFIFLYFKKKFITFRVRKAKMWLCENYQIFPLLSELLPNMFHKLLSSSGSARNLKEKKRVIASLSLALVPDCGAGCVEVSGRYIEKHSKTQHTHVIWLLMNKRPQKIKEPTSETRLTTDFLFQMVDKANDIVNHRGGCNYTVNKSPSYTNLLNEHCVEKENGG